MNVIITPLNKIATWFGNIIPNWFVPLLARGGVFSVFWFSAQTKITGWTVAGQHLQFWNITETTVMLFENEYDLPLLPPELAAYAGTITEFILALFILLGLFTRLSAFGLLMVTAIIQFFVYPDAWTTHLGWAAMLVYLLKEGGGMVALDRLLRIK